MGGTGINIWTGLGSWITFMSWTHWTKSSGLSAAIIWRFSLFCPTLRRFHSCFAFMLLFICSFVIIKDFLVIVVFEDTFSLTLWLQLQTFPSFFTFISCCSVLILCPDFAKEAFALAEALELALALILELALALELTLILVLVLILTLAFMLEFMFEFILLYLVVVVVVFIWNWFEPVIPGNKPHVHICCCSDWDIPLPQVHLSSWKFFLAEEPWLQVHLSALFWSFWFEAWSELSVRLFLVVIFWLKYS